MNRRQFLTGITGAAALSTFGIGTARAATTLKIGTLFTSSSIWGLSLKLWADNLKRKTGGMIQATIYYNGTQGDEASLNARRLSRSTAMMTSPWVGYYSDVPKNIYRTFLLVNQVRLPYLTGVR